MLGLLGGVERSRHVVAPLAGQAGAFEQDPQPEGHPALARHGFEIVDKRSNKEVFLDGSWAELFQQQILAWQQNTPSQEEVEDTLDRYAALLGEVRRASAAAAALA